MRTQARTVCAHVARPRRHYDATLARVAICAITLGILAGLLWSR